MVAPVFIVQADFSGTAFGGAPTWTDITAYVLTVEDPPVVINWGRQDEQSESQPRMCSMTLDNSDGRFTPGLTTGPYGSAVDVGVHIRVSATANAVTTVRFDGYVNDWDAGWDNGGPMATCAVDASDIFAQMGTLQPLQAIVVEEMLLDAPLALYPLDEAAGSTSAGDVTGKAPAAVVTNSKYGAGTLAFGTSGAIVGQSQMAGFTSPDVDSLTLAARATYLVIPPSALPATRPWSIVFAWEGAAYTVQHDEWIFTIPGQDSVSTFQVDIEIETNSLLRATVIGFNGLPVQATGTVGVLDGSLHIGAVTLAADGKTLSVYVDGVLYAQHVGIADTQWVRPAGRQGYAGVTMQGGVRFPLGADLALLGFYGIELSAARVAAHYNAAKTAFAGERTDVHAARLMSYRPNTGAALDVGKGTVGVHDTAGLTLQQGLEDTAGAEGGPIFADGQGRITLYNRARQYDPAVALTVDASLDQVDATLRFRRDTQDILNDATVSRPGGASQRVVNATSVSKYGTKAAAPTLVVNSDRDAADAAGWAVAVGKTVKTKSPQLTVDLLGEPSAAQAAAVLAAGPLSVVNITNLPAATSPATSVKAVIQGAVETIGVDAWGIGFYATALPPGTLRADAAASANTKLDSGLVIPW